MAEDRQLLTDLRLKLRRMEPGSLYVVDQERRRVVTRRGVTLVEDLATTSGRENLAQAIVVRLLVPRGELTALAHPEYGSRLHELIGRPNNGATLSLARLYILESLQQERRIARIVTLEVTPTPGTRDRVDVELGVLPIGETAVIDMGPFTLQL